MKIILPITAIGLEESFLPSSMISSLEGALDNIGVETGASRIQWSAKSITILQVLHIFQRLRMDFPLIPGSTLEFMPPDASEELSADGPSGAIGVEIKIGEDVEINLYDLSVRFTFPKDFLKAYERIS